MCVCREEEALPDVNGQRSQCGGELGRWEISGKGDDKTDWAINMLYGDKWCGQSFGIQWKLISDIVRLF